jgi:hypothetical protein
MPFDPGMTLISDWRKSKVSEFLSMRLTPRELISKKNNDLYRG